MLVLRQNYQPGRLNNLFSNILTGHRLWSLHWSGSHQDLVDVHEGGSKLRLKGTDNFIWLLTSVDVVILCVFYLEKSLHLIALRICLKFKLRGMFYWFVMFLSQSMKRVFLNSKLTVCVCVCVGVCVCVCGWLTPSPPVFQCNVSRSRKLGTWWWKLEPVSESGFFANSEHVGPEMREAHGFLFHKVR